MGAASQSKQMQVQKDYAAKRTREHMSYRIREIALRLYK